MSQWSSSLLPVTDPAITWEKVAERDPLPEGLGEATVDVTIAGSEIENLTRLAFREISHFLRTDHLESLSAILDDREASVNDRAVAIDLLKNAAIASGGVLPMCQDTGTAIVYARRGHNVVTDGRDYQYIEDGIRRSFTEDNLRYSQLAPLTTWTEVNTQSNLPAEIEISFSQGSHYEFLFIAKGGGSANKTFLYQETKELLRESVFLEFVEDKLRSLGTAACPPYHLSLVIGGTSADFAVKAAKLGAAHALDTLPVEGSAQGQGFRDLELEAKVLRLTQKMGIGAQFGGKYFCHDVRVVRLPRHTGSLPVALAVSCSADRQAFGRITREGIFLEQLDKDPARFLPDSLVNSADIKDVPEAEVNLDVPMAEILRQLEGLKVGTRVSLTGRMIVARDLAHAAIREQIKTTGKFPEYLRNHPVYYAAPAKTPEGFASGSFGPTTAGRMDGYVDEFQSLGGSLIMLAKGNRSPTVTDACRKNSGFYLATVGGPAALIAQENIRSLEIIDFEELGLEAVYAIDVVNFPAYVVIDNYGNDLYSSPSKATLRLGPTRTRKNRA
jgi:fumarate hydratase class I